MSCSVATSSRHRRQHACENGVRRQLEFGLRRRFEAECFQHVHGTFDQRRALLDQPMTSAVAAAVHRTRYRQYVAALLQRHPRRDQASAASSGLDDYNRRRESADDSIALREIRLERNRRRRVFADERTGAGDDLAREAPVAQRIDVAVSAAHHRDRHRGSVERAAMCTTVDPGRKTADDRKTRSTEIHRQGVRHLASRHRCPPAADDGQRHRATQRGEVALNEEREGWVRCSGQQRRIRIFEKTDRPRRRADQARASLGPRPICAVVRDRTASEADRLRHRSNRPLARSCRSSAARSGGWRLDPSAMQAGTSVLEATHTAPGEAVYCSVFSDPTDVGLSALELREESGVLHFVENRQRSFGGEHETVRDLLEHAEHHQQARRVRTAAEPYLWRSGLSPAHRACRWPIRCRTRDPRVLRGRSRRRHTGRPA